MFCKTSSLGCKSGEFSLQLWGIRLAIMGKSNLQKTTNLLGICQSYSNIGNIYTDLGKYDGALFYYKKYQEIAEDLKSNRDIATALTNIAGVYLKNDKAKEALNLLNKAEKIILEHSIIFIYPYILAHKVECLLGLGNYKKAKEENQKLEKVATDLSSLEHQLKSKINLEITTHYLSDDHAEKINCIRNLEKYLLENSENEFTKADLLYQISLLKLNIKDDDKECFNKTLLFLDDLYLKSKLADCKKMKNNLEQLISKTFS